jgi:hypothetical protein
MRNVFKLTLLILSFLAISCNKNKEIKRLLNSSRPYENIEGAYQAMKSDDLSYVPLILKISGRPGATTHLQFKGVTVYEESMYALQHLLHVKPPNPITNAVDSVNIKFYVNYWESNK